MIQGTQAWAFVQDEEPSPSPSPSEPSDTPVPQEPDAGIPVPAPAPPGVSKKPVNPNATVAPKPPLGARPVVKPGHVQTVPNLNSPVVPKPTAPVGTAPGLAPNKGKAGNAGLKQIRKGKRKETAESLLKRRGATDVDAVIVGEAQVLPKNVFRMRYILRDVKSDKGYDNAGKESKVGATLNVKGHAFVLEYGLADRWTLQMVTPYTSSNELAINANTFKKSPEYAKQYQKLMDAVIPRLIAKGLCSTAENCRTAIDSGLSLGIATPIELPTGETATVGANVPIREAANSIILKALEPSDGKAGLGDIQFGAAYNAYTSPRNVGTIGLGIRIPTGNFMDVASAYRAPGSGYTAVGIRFLYDLRLSPVIISLSHTMEYSLTKAKKSRSSLLNPKFLNAGNPTIDDGDVAGAGDGELNNGLIERKGVYHEGFTRAAYALGSLHRWLKPVAVYGYYGWIVNPEQQNEGHLYSKKYELYTASFAFSVDGLAMDPMLPVSFTYRRELAIGGRNATIAPSSDYYQFNFYYKF